MGAKKCIQILLFVSITGAQPAAENLLEWITRPTDALLILHGQVVALIDGSVAITEGEE